MKRLKRFVTLEWLILLMWILGMGIYFSSAYNDPDTPWHYATGLYILAHHYVPTHDVFSWSSKGMPWVTQEWLFEVIFAWVGTHLGFPGAWALQTAIMSITLFVLYRLGVHSSGGNRVISSLLACAGIYGGIVFWTMRPQMISYMMFAVFLLLLAHVREGNFKVLWLVPPLMLFWANAHGSSLIGLLVLVLEVVISFIPTIGRFTKVVLPKGARWRLVSAAIVGGAVGLINPNGTKAYTYALLGTNSFMTNNIMEWHSPDFHIDSFKYGVIPFLLILFLLLSIRFKTVPIREVIFIGGCFAEFLISQRFMPYLAIAAVPLAASLTSDWVRVLNRPSGLMRILNAVILAVWVGIFCWNIPVIKGPVADHWSNNAYPVGAVNYLEKNHLTSRVLNKYSFGGYLILRGIPTFVDGRTDVFMNNGVFSDYLALQNVWWEAPDLLDKYHFQAAVFSSGDSIVTYLTGTGKWKVAYSDNGVDVLVPTSTAVSTSARA